MGTPAHVAVVEILMPKSVADAFRRLSTHCDRTIPLEQAPETLSDGSQTTPFLLALKNGWMVSDDGQRE
jgi:hypothetical protein